MIRIDFLLPLGLFKTRLGPAQQFLCSVFSVGVLHKRPLLLRGWRLRPHHLLRLLFAAENNRVEVVAAAERGGVHGMTGRRQARNSRKWRV